MKISDERLAPIRFAIGFGLFVAAGIYFLFVDTGWSS